jgi:hypothetical protein
MPFFEQIIACALSLLCLATPENSAKSSFELRMTDSNGTTSAVSLTCHPDGGTHPKPKHACSELAAVNGDFGLLKPHHPTPCTFLYQPVDVSANGYWRGNPVKFATTYGNRCMAAVNSNGIFDF